MNHLIERAQDFRAELVSKEELNQLWEAANSGMHADNYLIAFSATEALLCQAERGNVCVDELCDPRKTKVGESRSAEMMQGFVDRVESLNFLVRARNRKND